MDDRHPRSAMYHIRLTAPITARARRIITEHNADVSSDGSDKSARFVTLPGWFQPELVKRVERELHDAQAGRWRRGTTSVRFDDGYAIKVRATVWGQTAVYLVHVVEEDGEVRVYDSVAGHYVAAPMSKGTAARIRREWAS